MTEIVLLYRPGWISSNNAIGRNAFCDNSTGHHNRVSSNTDTRQYDTVCTDPNISFNYNLLKFITLISKILRDILLKM